jgi:hypothetical protein
MARLTTAQIASDDGDQITGNTGTYTYAGSLPANTAFIVQSDTAGNITGKTASGKTLTLPVPAYGVTRVQLVSVDLATTRTGALSAATLLAIPV